MGRRRFLGAAGLAMTAPWLTQCSSANEQPDSKEDIAVREPSMDLGPLRHGRSVVRGTNIHFLDSSDSAPRGARAVVLVHGSGLSGRYMIPTARELAKEFRVLVPDMPGFGDSDKPEEIYEVPGLADWVAWWMPTVGLERASLLGNSFGCQIIADLAARYPGRVERAILQGPTTPPEERSAFWQFIRWRQNQRFNPPSLGDVTSADYKKCGFMRMYRSFRSQLEDRIEDKAPRIQAPVLVVRGEHDPIANQAWCELIVRLCPRGRLALIPGVAHTLCYTAPVELANVTGAFVTQAD